MNTDTTYTPLRQAERTVADRYAELAKLAENEYRPDRIEGKVSDLRRAKAIEAIETEVHYAIKSGLETQVAQRLIALSRVKGLVNRVAYGSTPQPTVEEQAIIEWAFRKLDWDALEGAVRA